MPTTDALYERANVLGLDLCEAEDGPTIRELYSDQPDGEVVWLAMKQIAGSDGDPSVFKLSRRSGFVCLFSHIARPDIRWYLCFVLVFRLRKPSSSPPKAD